MIFLVVIVLLILLAIQFYIHQKYSYWKEQEVPCPETYLFFGNIGKILLLKTTLSEFLGSLYSHYNEFSYVGFYNLLTPAVVFRDPEIINEVLIKNFDSFHDVFIKTPDPVAEINPFYANGNRWKEIRREVAPHVSNLKVKAMQPLIENVCKQMIKYIQSSNEDCLNAEDITYRFTGGNVMSCAYGLQSRHFEEENPIMFKIRDDMAFINPKLAKINHTLGIMFPNLARLLKISYFGRYTPNIFKNMISESLEARKNNKFENKDYPQFLQETKEKYQDLTHFGYAFLFYLDGFDTSALVFTYALLELSQHPKIQVEAQKQIDEIGQKYKCIYDPTAQKEMTYIDNIIFETTRKHPIIKFLNRLCTKNVELPSPKGGDGRSVTIKKGTQVFIPINALHNDPKYFDEPNNFDPNRFNLEESLSRPKLSYLGFGDGPRICLGRQFGITQIRMGLIAILSHFHLSLDEKTVLPITEDINHISKLPKEKIWIKFLPRQ